MRVPGIFRWGQFARCGTPETSGSVSRLPAPGKSPYRESFPPSAAADVEIGSAFPVWPPLKRNRKPPAFQSECRGFSDGGGLPGAAPPCGSAPEASGSGKPDQLTPVLSAGTVMGRAGCVKSRGVQTFPHFAGRPVENRGRPGDRKKPAVPVEQPVLNRQTQALWLAASMASIIAARTPASSMARMPRMVVPPGEQTLSLSAPGCRPLSSSILPAPITVWAASS